MTPSRPSSADGSASNPSAAPDACSAAEQLEAEGPLFWVAVLFGEYVTDDEGELIPFADHQVDFWRWLWSIRLGHLRRAMVMLWPRAGGKSSSAEMGCVCVGGRATRRYVLYVSGTQERADDHVGNIASMLESPLLGQFYPDLGTRLVGKYGHPRGWRRNRLRTAKRFTIDALGLDTAARGVKLEHMRPDMIVLDDIDAEGDSAETVDKKTRTLTTAVLPAGSDDCIVLGVQNLVHANSVFARLASNDLQDGAPFLTDRLLSGPIPSLRDFRHETRYHEPWGRMRTFIAAGEPTWAGQSVEKCQALIDRYGIVSFLKENQHLVQSDETARFKRAWWRRYSSAELWQAGLKPKYAFADAADEDGIANDWTAISVWGQLPDNQDDLFVMDAVRRHVDLPGFMELSRDIYAKWRVPLVVENKGNGRALIQLYRKRSRTLDGVPLKPIPVIPFEPGSERKEGRADLATPHVEAGRVWLPDDAAWAHDWIEEHALFPNGPHDDWVDNTSMAIAKMIRRTEPPRGQVRKLVTVGGRARNGLTLRMPRPAVVPKRR